MRTYLAVLLLLAFANLTYAQAPPNNGTLLVPNAAIAVGAGSGTVTSVGASFTGGIISIAGGSPPITSSGTFAFTLAGTSGGIPYFDTATSWASSGLLTTNAIMIGGGAGAAPSTTTTGSGVLTAIGAAINATTGLPNVDGAITIGDCLKWGPGVQDFGAACTAAYTAAANGGLTLTGTAFSLGDGSGITYTNPGQILLATGTITTNVPSLSTTVTWNAGGVTFDAPWKLNVTNTASAAASLLEDLQIGGASQFNVGIFGNVVALGNGATSAVAYQYGVTTTGFRLSNNFGGSGQLGLLRGDGTAFAGMSTTLFDVPAAFGIGGSISGANSTITAPVARTFHFGAADANPPLAQTFAVQNAVTGSNIAGVNWTLNGSLPTGSGAGGDIIFQTGFQGVAASTTITFNDSTAGANTCTVNWTSNGFSANQAFTFSGGVAPTGMTAGTTYYVLTPSTNSFTCSATPGGTILAITTNGSGTITGTTATSQQPPIIAMTIKGGTQQINFAQPFQLSSSTTGAGTETFTNSPCSGLTTEQWAPVKIAGQTGTWFIPACQ